MNWFNVSGFQESEIIILVQHSEKFQTLTSQLTQTTARKSLTLQKWSRKLDDI